MCWLKNYFRDFPGDPVVKNLPSNAGDASSIPGWRTKNPHVTWYSRKKKNYFNWVSFLLKKKLFIFWLCWVLVDMHRVSLVEMSRGGGVGGCYIFFVVVHELLIVVASPVAGAQTRACGVQKLPTWASVALGACVIFPDLGWNPCPLHWQGDSYPLYHQGSPHLGFLCYK